MARVRSAIRSAAPGRLPEGTLSMSLPARTEAGRFELLRRASRAKIRGNSIQRIAAMCLGVVRCIGAEKTIESLLHQVVRQLTVAGQPR